jgi:hypothetical protein
MRAADLGDDRLKPFVADDRLVALSQERCAQSVDVVWQRVAYILHSPMRLAEDEKE